MNTTTSSDLKKKTKEELIEEIRRLRESSENNNGENGTFDEDKLIEMGSPRAGDEMYVATGTGRIVYANELFADELGYTPDELKELKVPDIDTVHSRAQWLHLVSKAKKTGKSLTFETRFNVNEGGTIPMEIIATAITYNGKSYVLCQAKAVGEVKEEQPEVRKSNGTASGQVQEAGLLDTVLGTVSEGVVFVDTKGSITSANPTAARMLGTALGEVIGKSYVEPRWRMTDAQGSPVKISDHPASVALVTETPVMNKRMGISQPDGTTKHMFINAAPLFADDTKMTGAVFTMRYQSSIPESQIEAPPEEKPDDGIGTLARRAADASTVYEIERAVCDLLVESGDYGVVWVGTKETEESRVEPSYSAGETSDYLLKIKERADESETGKGPTGTAYKTKKPSIVNDIATSEDYNPWKRQALRSNLQSVASFPILVHGKVYGVLNLAAFHRNHFSEPVTEYLTGVTNFISFAIEALRDREINAELEENNVLKNLLVDTYMQNTDAAVAVFEAKEPFLCKTANEGFLAMLDEPFRSAGVEDALLTDFSMSHIHKDIFDALIRALEDLEPQTEEGAEFETIEGDIQRWNWIVFPIMHGENISSLLYFAVRMTDGESSEEAHLLDNLSVPVYSVSHEKREVLYANPAAEEAFGLKMGMPTSNAVPFMNDLAKTYQDNIKKELKKLTAKDAEEIELTYKLKPRGAKKSVDYRHIVSGRFSEAGVLRGVQCVVLPSSDGK